MSDCILHGNNGSAVDDRFVFTFTAAGLFQYPEDVIIPNTVTSLTGNSAQCLAYHPEIKTLRFEEGSTVATIPMQMFTNSSGIEYMELPASLTYVDGYGFSGCTNLKTLIFKSSPTFAYTWASAANPFNYCTRLEDVQIPPDWTSDMYLSAGTYSFTNVLTHDSLVAMIANLHDYTGDTTHTLTVGATNLSRLSAEEKAVAAAKNWTLA